MRYAASTLGTLDGARAQAPVGGGFSVGAFGGVLPDPINAAPSVAAQRFGVEATLNRPDLSLRPEAALVFHGSTFEGKLDEKRASGMFGVYPGQSRLGGHFEVSSFDSGNPWRASPIELTAAGLDTSVRVGPLQFGARGDVRQPVRSRWLASYLPLSWFCTTLPGGAPGAEACNGKASLRAVGTADVGLQVSNVSLTVGGTKISDIGETQTPDMLGLFAAGRVVRIAKRFRVDASGNYSQSTFVDMFGGSAGPGVTLLDDVIDFAAYYRNATLRYRAASPSLVQHGVGGTLMLFPSGQFLFTLQGEGITGADASAVVLFATMMWRPRL
jgi:hypothetical protein